MDYDTYLKTATFALDLFSKQKELHGGCDIESLEQLKAFYVTSRHMRPAGNDGVL